MSTHKQPRESIVSRLGKSWQLRHLAVIAVSLLGTWMLLESRAQWSDMHRWNRALGDMSVVLIALAMLLGPVARLSPRLARLVPWRRECGIYAIVLAIAHTVIILDGWVEWDLVRLFGYEFHPALRSYVMVQHGFGLANIVGIVALLYGIVLAMTSNDLSQRLLRGPTWKFVQQRAYVLWVLVLLHTAYFIYLHFQSYHRSVPEPNWAQVPLLVLVGVVGLLQLLAFLRTWRARRPARATS